MNDMRTNRSLFSMGHGQFTNASNLTTTTKKYFPYKSGDLIYPAFAFEKVIDLYVLVILVVMTLIANLVVSFVLTRKPLRNATNMLLVAIAITDSLTGLVMLPSYIMVYESTRWHPSTYPDDLDVYFFRKELCIFKMLSSLYFSRVFHTMSIWLTVYLGIQRFACVKFPFAAKTWFSKNTHILVCVGVFLLAPILHIYHLTNRTIVSRKCTWQVENPCTKSCAHLMATLMLMHLIPCIVLSLTTGLFVYHILYNRFDGGNDQMAQENRRASKIVIAIVVCFLIPELPYAIFLVYLKINLKKDLFHLHDLKFNRTVTACYEVFTLLSFNANFYIFTFLNRKFRRELKGFSCVEIIMEMSQLPTQAVYKAQIHGRRRLVQLKTYIGLY